MVTEARFPIMGSTGHIVVVGGPDGLVGIGVGRLEQLEALWSRFRPTSELSQLNDAGGSPCLVSGPTVILIEALQLAWERTDGRFDPTVGEALCNLGYDRPWPLLAPPIRLPAARRSTGLTGGPIDLTDGLVRLPPGVTLDPGGLGKGLAADLVATEMMAQGAEGVLVNVGGDLRVIGRPPEGDEWLIAVEDPEPAPADAPRPHLAHLGLTGGGIATSTLARRRWTAGDGSPVHHLIDPATSLPATSSRRQVTVVAGCAWWAEAMSKVVFLDGTLPDTHSAALVVEDGGGARSLGRLDRFTRQLEAAT